MVAVQAAIATAVNAVDEKYTWKTLVEFQSGGSFTLPDDATWGLFIIYNDNGNIQEGCCIYSVKSSTTHVTIPCNDQSRSIWVVSNSGFTFTYTSGTKKISVYYR